MSLGSEKLSVLLLADTLTAFVPNEQVIIDPGLVPQPPVQLNDTSEHWFGSTNPSCAAVRLAPNGVFPSTVRLAGPLRVGSVACTAPNASARPIPNVLSGFGLLRMTAWPTMRFRSVVRALGACGAGVGA